MQHLLKLQVCRDLNGVEDDTLQVGGRNCDIWKHVHLEQIHANDAPVILNLSLSAPHRPFIVPSSSPHCSFIVPLSSFYHPLIAPSLSLHRPFIVPSSSPHCSFIVPSSSPHCSFIVPSSSLHRPFIVPSLFLHRPFIVPSSSPHRPLIVPSSSPHCSFIVPSSSPHCSFIVPSSSLHRPFIVPSLFLHRPFIVPSSSPHCSFIVPSLFLHRPFIVPSSSPHRPLIVPSSSPHCSFIVPSSSPHCSFIVPSLFPHRSFIVPSSSLHRPLIVPSLFLHCSLIVPSLFLHRPFIVPSLFLHRPFIVPSLFPHRPLIVPSLFPHRPLIVPSSSLHRPLIVPSSSPHCSFIVPSSSPHCSFIVPSLFPHRSFIVPSSSLHRPLIVPSLFLHCSLIVPSLFLHRPFIVPSLFLHRPFIVPSLFLHRPLIVPSSSPHRPLIVPSSSPHRPLIVPSSSLHRPFIVPSSSPHCSFIVPSSSLHRPLIVPSSSLHRPFIVPSSSPHCSFIVPSLFLHRPLIVPSLFLHRPFIVPSSFLHCSFIVPSSSPHRPLIVYPACKDEDTPRRRDGAFIRLETRRFHEVMNNSAERLPAPTPRSADPGRHSSGASGSSSESESSSESDSDSESSSSDSECNRASRATTPEPEPPSTNKWQLDKWLNKVTPHNKVLTNTQTETLGPGSSQPEDVQAPDNQTGAKTKPNAALVQPDPKDRALLSPVREKAKPKTNQKAPDGKSTKVKTGSCVDLPPSRRSTGKKQPKKVDQSSNSEEPTWTRPGNSSSTPKEKEPPPLEPAKPRGRASGGKTAPRKEPRSTTGTTASTPTTASIPVPDKKKHRGPSKITPKSKEFIETESSSSECHSDSEELSKVHLPCPGPNISNLKSKDCNSNILSVSSLASTSSTSIPDPGATDLLEEPLFSPISIVPNELLSPLRDFEDVKSLWVKIELSLLSRIPGQDPPEPPPTKAECRESAGFKHRRQQSPASVILEKTSSKSKRKHKSDHCEVLSASKKLKLEKEVLLLPPCISPIQNHKLSSAKDSSKKQPRKLLPPLLSPLSDEPVGRQRRSSESSTVSTEGNTSAPASQPSIHSIPPSSSSLSSSSSSHKHRRGESKVHSKTSSEEDGHVKSSSVHSNGQSDPSTWLNPAALTTENTEHRRPKLTFNNTVHSAEHYMQEAKKLKHKADALMEKFGKAINYADGALSFIECGNAMERDPLEAKSPYTMYSETVELIRYAMRLKNFTSHSATLAEKKLAVLCNRCLSLLYLRMFRLKKDHAMKYSRSLMEYFKNSAKSSQAPSPWGSNGKSTGTPSPMSLSPSPVNSVNSSTGAAGSSSSSSSSSGTVAIPQRIHHMAASHVNITNNILRSYEHWDTADKLAHESQEFFQELDSLMDPLTQHSSMTDLVRYIRQGLHWLRIEAHLL
ncbi:AF4/FMR2 family member 2-like [Trichomycterus rosablanca]|uniref:AF4/FMR2 family member 2-like n=1 Tax=Trichomycterus rosablanca TaxID=2290929 RepID=UPI002F357848